MLFCTVESSDVCFNFWATGGSVSQMLSQLLRGSQRPEGTLTHRSCEIPPKSPAQCLEAGSRAGGRTGDGGGDTQLRSLGRRAEQGSLKVGAATQPGAAAWGGRVGSGRARDQRCEATMKRREGAREAGGTPPNKYFSFVIPSRQEKYHPPIPHKAGGGAHKT